MLAIIRTSLYNYWNFIYFFLFIKTTKKMENYNLPAFPPQVAQDNLGRIIAPIPGMSKLEYFAIQLLPVYLQLREKHPLADKGEPITPIQAAVRSAKTLLDELKNQQNEKDNLQIVE